MVENNSRRVDESVVRNRANLDNIILEIDKGTFKTELAQGIISVEIAKNYSCLPSEDSKKEYLAAFKERGYDVR